MCAINHKVAEAARAAGFAMVGFARLRRLEERAEFYGRWLADGRAATMTYLAQQPERRLDPRTLDPRLAAVVSLAYPYAAPVPPPALAWRDELRGRIAAYALGPDYHDYVLRAARAVADALAALRPGALTRVYVDTGPVFEREWAAAAQLGWFGKNTMLLNRERGSYFFLAEIFTDAEFETTVEPYGEFCGTCRRCLELCPTRALGDGYRMEPRLCISYLTIEHRGAIPRALRPKLGEWIFGCDICQEVCPWNGDVRAGARGNYDLVPYLPELLALDDAGFSRRFSRSAVKRAKRRGLLRNVAVALGNTGNRDAVPHLARALESEPDALVRGHAAWALGTIGGARARDALERARTRETDRDALVEIDAALGNTPPPPLVK
jgi:epoxyqueuosine reductase